MGWTVIYREYEIHAKVTPVRAGNRGIVAFIPLASVYRRHDRALIAEIGASGNQTFSDVTAAALHVVSRAKSMVDGDEEALT